MHYLQCLDVFSGAWLCQMSLRTLWDILNVDRDKAFHQCVTACGFSDFLALKMLYYILGTERRIKNGLDLFLCLCNNTVYSKSEPDKVKIGSDLC